MRTHSRIAACSYSPKPPKFPDVMKQTGLICESPRDLRIIDARDYPMEARMPVHIRLPWVRPLPCSRRVQDRYSGRKTASLAVIGWQGRLGWHGGHFSVFIISAMSGA